TVGSWDGIDRSEVDELVADLVDKSIVIRADESCEREARFRQLVTVRQYGGRQLALSGEELAVRERHLAYYRALANRGETQFCGEYDEAATMFGLAEQFGDTTISADADWCAALRAVYRGDTRTAVTLLDRSLARSRAVSDMAGVYRTFIVHGIAAFDIAPDE